MTLRETESQELDFFNVTCLEVCRGTRERLDVDTPFLRIQLESLESTLLTKQFNLVDIFVSSIVASTWVSFAILIGEDRAQSF